MRLRTAKPQDYEQIERLYESAFPKEERKAFQYIIRIQPDIGLLVIEEDHAFCGFFSLVLYKDIVCIDYFAVSEAFRGKKIGTRALLALKEHYPGRKIALEIETPVKTAVNYAQRIRRQAFYERSGFTMLGLRFSVFVNDYSLMTLGGEISEEEYLEIVKIMYDRKDVGTFTKKIVEEGV